MLAPFAERHRERKTALDFELPREITDYLSELDAFIEREIRPLEQENIQYFDHRREHARTDWDRDGLPNREWEALLGEMRARADRAGHLRYGMPRSLGGQDGTHLAMAVIREHLAAKGLGLHNDLQNESSIVGNFPFTLMMQAKGTPEQKAEFLEASITGERRVAFGLTEPDHGSDATHMESVGAPRGRRVGAERAQALEHRDAPRDPRHGLRPHEREGRETHAASPASSSRRTLPGIEVGPFWWTFNMPTDHPDVDSSTDVRVPETTRCSAKRGVASSWRRCSSTRTASGRPRAPSGAAQYCIDEAVAYARERAPFGTPLWKNQAIQFPLAELQTEAAMLRVPSSARRHGTWIKLRPSDGGHGPASRCATTEPTGWSAMPPIKRCRPAAVSATTRHMPFEHIYRHHRRYRITEGAEEIQIRRVAGVLFGREIKR